MVVEEVTEITDELVRALAGLMAQLAPSSPPPTRAILEQIVRSTTTRLFVARLESGAVAGTLTLAWYRTPGVFRVWIEDVVVDQAARGQGVGQRLVQVALEHARALGAVQVDLTSSPSKEAANRLYRRIGFVQRETNAYRYVFPK